MWGNDPTLHHIYDKSKHLPHGFKVSIVSFKSSLMSKNHFRVKQIRIIMEVISQWDPPFICSAFRCSKTRFKKSAVSFLVNIFFNSPGNQVKLVCWLLQIFFLCVLITTKTNIANGYAMCFNKCHSSFAFHTNYHLPPKLAQA